MSPFDEQSLVDALTGMVPRLAIDRPRTSRVVSVLGLAGCLAVLLTLVGAAALPRAVGPPSFAAPTVRDADESVIAPTDSVTTPAPVPPAQPPRIASAAVGRGGTLNSTLERLGVPVASRGLVVTTVGRFVDPRRLQPHTAVAATFDQGPDAGGYSVAVRNDPDRFLRVTVHGDAPPFSIRSELVRLPIVTSVERAGGIVRSSVAQALAHSPHGTRLTEAFSDVFQWDVDLLVDPRPGDTVRIVYEAHRLGQPPVDLPQLAGAPNEAGELVRVGRILAAAYEGQIARSEGYWLVDRDGVGSYFDGEGRPLRKTFLKSPLNYRRISSGFSRGRFHPVLRKVVPHSGVDFAAAAGTPVVATADGTVVAAGWDGPLGRTIRLRHGSSYVTVYGHLKGFATGVRAGLAVKQNQVIGYVGSTGRATGPHLHYTMLRAGRPIDPMRFESPSAAPLPADRLSHLEETKRRWQAAIQSDPGADGGAVATATTEGLVREGA